MKVIDLDSVHFTINDEILSDTDDYQNHFRHLNMFETH